MPADRAQSNQKEGKVPKPIPASLCDAPTRKLGKALSSVASRKNGVTDQASHSENSKPQDVTVYTDSSVIKERSRRGSTFKQGATTIHEDSAVYTVSIFSLTMEMEAVTHALRWIATTSYSQTTHAIILTHLESLLQKSEKLN